MARHRMFWPLIGAAAFACAAVPQGHAQDNVKTVFAPFYTGLQDDDLAKVGGAVQYALETQPSGNTHFWTNPGTGNAGSITPLATYRTSRNFFCRDYREIVFTAKAGRAARLLRACRDHDGQWKLVPRS